MLVKLFLSPVGFVLHNVMVNINVPVMGAIYMQAIIDVINKVSYFLPMDTIAVCLVNICYWLVIQLFISAVMFLLSFLGKGR